MFPERLSKNFTTHELVRSYIATKHGLDNTPPDELLPNARRLVALLEEARTIIGRTFGHEIAFDISSGYRSEPVNTKARGARNSAHKRFRAADGTFRGVSTELAFKALAKSKLAFDKLILERDEDSIWIHIQIAEEGEQPARKAFTAVRDEKGTTYKAWQP